ncbi:hypothetical protein JW964_21635 [candidate division KSB1 bacterium]|nr:hypothetical protein [candidate division KSB1 bacterium]
MTTTEVEANFKTIWELFKETDTKFKETDAKFKETDERLDRRFKETDRHLRRMENLFNGQWGKLIESLAESGIVELLQQRGIAVNKLSRRIEARKNGHQTEIDFLITNSEELVVGEVKTTLKVADVKDFLNKLDEFLLFFPEYKSYKVFGAVIGIKIEEYADKFAYRNGLFVLKGGGKLKMLNDDKFRPVDFGKTES